MISKPYAGTGIGSKGFVERVRSLLGVLAKGRKSIEAGEAYQLREPSVQYSDHFGGKKDDIGHENSSIWNFNI